MFAQTRIRLTIYFSVMIVLLLVVVNGTIYAWVSAEIYKDRKADIQLLADREYEEHKWELPTEEAHEDEDDHDHNDSAMLSPEAEKRKHSRDREVPVADLTVLRPFYFILDEDGRWISGEKPDTLETEQLVDTFEHWIPRINEVKTVAFTSDSGMRRHFLFAGRPVILNGEYLGSVFAGADITQQATVLHKLVFVLSILSVVFLLVSIILGYLMSEKAMVPIARAFERQRRFVADASHELRTPLSVIQSSLEVLEAEEGENIREFSRQVLGELKDEVGRMTSLVAGMLALARADSAEYQLKLEQLSLKDELEKAVRKLKPLADEKRLRFTLQAEPGAVAADRERIGQLLMILLDNAIQYTPEEGTVFVGGELNDTNAIITVKDSGIGIAEEHHEQIFSRFYRIDTARSRTGSNLGLGLSIAKWIVDSHGGTISVESAPGTGSTFTVKLPLQRKK